MFTVVERDEVTVVLDIEVVPLYNDILYDELVLIYDSLAFILIVNPRKRYSATLSYVPSLLILQREILFL